MYLTDRGCRIRYFDFHKLEDQRLALNSSLTMISILRLSSCALTLILSFMAIVCGGVLLLIGRFVTAFPNLVLSRATMLHPLVSSVNCSDLASRSGPRRSQLLRMPPPHFPSSEISTNLMYTSPVRDVAVLGGGVLAECPIWGKIWLNATVPW